MTHGGGALLVACASWLLCAAASTSNPPLESELKAGQWLELPGTAMQQVFPKREGHPAWGVLGPSAVMSSWGGAAYDSTRDVLVVTGGGHTDYGGNEVYEFHLRNRQWLRATEPSAMRALTRTGADFCSVARSG